MLLVSAIRGYLMKYYPYLVPNIVSLKIRVQFLNTFVEYLSDLLVNINNKIELYYIYHNR